MGSVDTFQETLPPSRLLRPGGRCVPRRLRLRAVLLEAHLNAQHRVVRRPRWWSYIATLQKKVVTHKKQQTAAISIWCWDAFDLECIIVKFVILCRKPLALPLSSINFNLIY